MPRAKPKPAPERAWPAASVEMRPIKSLLSYPRNARTHSSEQVDQIAASMTRWGWTVPVLVDEKGMLIAGHGRVLAANKLGFAEIPVMVAAGWAEDEKRAYRLADNQIPQNAGWDMELLKFELKDLKLEGFEMELTGFGDMQLVSFMSGVNDVNGEWTGMPAFETGGNDWHRSIMVHFESQKDVDDFVKKLGISITDDTKTVFLPKKRNIPLKGKQYEGTK